MMFRFYDWNWIGFQCFWYINILLDSKNGQRTHDLTVLILMRLLCTQQMLSATIHRYQHHIVVCLDRRRRLRRHHLRPHPQRFAEINWCVHRLKCSAHDGNRHQCRTEAIKMTIAQRKRSQHRGLTLFPNDLAENWIETLRKRWPRWQQSESHHRQQQWPTQLKPKRISSMHSPPKRMPIRKRQRTFHTTYPWMLHPKRPLCYKYPSYARPRISTWSKNRCAWIRAFASW